MKINRKCLKREALERSQECRNLYFLDVSRFTHEMLVFLDESAANEHEMHRKRALRRSKVVGTYVVSKAANPKGLNCGRLPGKHCAPLYCF